MSDLHDEEFEAEISQYVLWCEGRLEELRRAGLVEGRSALTEAGWNEYRKLVASGCVPSIMKVIWTLKSDLHVPPKMIEQMAALMVAHDGRGK